MECKWRWELFIERYPLPPFNSEFWNNNNNYERFEIFFLFTLANEFDERSRLYDLRDCVWGDDENEKKPSDCPSKSFIICCSFDLLRPKLFYFL